MGHYFIHVLIASLVDFMRGYLLYSIKKRKNILQTSPKVQIAFLIIIFLRWCTILKAIHKHRGTFLLPSYCVVRESYAPIQAVQLERKHFCNGIMIRFDIKSMAMQLFQDGKHSLIPQCVVMKTCFMYLL